MLPIIAGRVVNQFLSWPVQQGKRIMRIPRRLRETMAMWKDLEKFEAQGGLLRDAFPACKSSRRLLIVSLSDWLAQVKMEAILGSAMRSQGLTPWVLTNSTCRWGRRYFEACGITQMVFLDEMLSRQGEYKAEADAVASALLCEPISFQSLLDIQYRGVYLGRHVLSSVVRTMLRGRVQFDDPNIKQALWRLLRNAIRNVYALEVLIDQVQPELALFMEKGYTPYGEAFDQCVNRGINTIQWTHSHRTDALVLKRYTEETRHMHPFSLSTETWDTFRELSFEATEDCALMDELKGRYSAGTWFNRKYLNVGKRIKSAEEVRQQLNLDPQRKTAIIFSHILWDATFFFGTNLFPDYETWLVETVKIACANPSVNWVVKLHPDYIWKFRLLNFNGVPQDYFALESGIGRLPEHVKVLGPDTDISTGSLFNVADYCVTVRGTIGIEMACFGIPVLTAGTGRYSGFGFTIDSETPEEYLERLRFIQDIPPLSDAETVKAKKYAYALFKLRPCVFTTFESVQEPMDRLGHPLDHNVVLRARSSQDICEAVDLRAFADWAVNSQMLDFMSSDIPVGIK